MRKPEKVRFELRTNQNLSRQNLQRAYESLSVEEPEIVNDIPVIGAFIRGLKHIVRKCIRCCGHYRQPERPENRRRRAGILCLRRYSDS